MENSLTDFKNLDLKSLQDPGELKKVIVGLEQLIEATGVNNLPETNDSFDKRKEVAKKITRTSNIIDGKGKESVAELKAEAKKTDVWRKKIRDFLSDKKDKILAPVQKHTIWIEKNQRAIADLKNILFKIQSAKILGEISGIELTEYDNFNWHSDYQAQGQELLCVIKTGLEEKSKYFEREEQYRINKLATEKAKAMVEQQKNAEVEKESEPQNQAESQQTGPTISVEQRSKLTAELEIRNIDISKILKWASINNLKDLSPDRYNLLMKKWQENPVETVAPVKTVAPVEKVDIKQEIIDCLVENHISLPTAERVYSLIVNNKIKNVRIVE